MTYRIDLPEHRSRYMLGNYSAIQIVEMILPGYDEWLKQNVHGHVDFDKQRWIDPDTFDIVTYIQIIYTEYNDFVMHKLRWGSET